MPLLIIYPVLTSRQRRPQTDVHDLSPAVDKSALRPPPSKGGRPSKELSAAADSFVLTRGPGVQVAQGVRWVGSGPPVVGFGLRPVRRVHGRETSPTTSPAGAGESPHTGNVGTHLTADSLATSRRSAPGAGDRLSDGDPEGRRVHRDCRSQQLSGVDRGHRLSR